MYFTRSRLLVGGPLGRDPLRNTVRNFGEMQLTMFEKYMKQRSCPDFCDEEEEELRILVVGLN